ncbi:CxC ATPase DNA modification system associated small protein [Agrobacterium sp. 10MFCol1.1]|uniref:CxC ATPase DNA modification system associated small protein n=1 Tax=Agrobacterium sp. 10MFCol1.1 TaxID=1150775 RepID=UPI00036AF5B1|nr:CxC ATPase DNA modification system associated small protein [Agrobacterium sp. 10MFCol1.1]
MALDNALAEALREAVDESDQPRALSLRLEAWLLAMTAGDDSQEAQAQRYEDVRLAVQLEEQPSAH